MLTLAVMAESRTPPHAAVVHMTSVHPWNDPRILTKECCSLADAGYEVILLSSDSDSRRHGGVRVQGLAIPRQRASRVLLGSWRMYRAALASKAAVCHFHDPEMIPVAVLLRLHGRKVIYDVHEDLPRQVANKSWIPAKLRSTIARLSAILEWLAGRIMNCVVAATPAIAARFPTDKTVLVQNFPRLEEFRNPSLAYKERPPCIAYVGGVEVLRGGEEMVRAMSNLEDYPAARLVLAGRSSPPSFATRLKHLPGAERTAFVGWLDRAEVANLLGQAKIGLVVLHPTPNYVEAQPTKLYEYMAAGVPVVASDFPGWRTIVLDNKCGLVVDPLDPSAIAKAIAWLLEHPAEAAEMGERGRQASLTHFNWSSEADRLVRAYRELLR